MASERLVHIVAADADRCQVLKRLLHSAGLTAVVYETAHALLDAALTDHAPKIPVHRREHRFAVREYIGEILHRSNGNDRVKARPRCSAHLDRT